MNANGDAGQYPCSRCGEHLALVELLEHIENHVLRTQGSEHDQA